MPFLRQAIGTQQFCKGRNGFKPHTHNTHNTFIVCTTADITAAAQGYKYLILYPICGIHTLAVEEYNIHQQNLSCRINI